MKKTQLAIAFALGLGLAAGASAQTLTITNASSSDINAIYISQSGNDNWEENIIEGKVLPSGYQVPVNLKGFGNSNFDLMVESTDGGQEDYRDFPGNTTSITIKGGGSADYQ